MELTALNQTELDGFVTAQPNSQILQSYNWGEFQKAAGHKVWRFGLLKENKLITAATITGYHLPLGKSYLYCPRGPVFGQQLTEEQKDESLKLILSKARDLTIQTKASEEIFFRIEPTCSLPTTNYSLTKTKSIQPPDTLLLDLNNSEEDLLLKMHSKTRYNIRLAQKHQITVKESKDFSAVWPIFKMTSSRDKFNLHSQNYYQLMLKTVPDIKLLIAEKDGQPIAANLVSFYGDTATYLHGASDHHFRQLMAPVLLQWQAIKQAKNNGCKYYDFHGIAPTDDKNHPWAGITRFKKSFGGQTVNYPGTYDFIYETNWYKLYQLSRKINRLIRR